MGTPIVESRPRQENSRAGREPEAESPASKESVWVFVGLVAISASTLLMEIALTKFLAYKVYHHFTYGVVGMVIFAFGMAGTYVYMRSRKGVEALSWHWISKVAAWYSSSLIAAVLFFCWVPIDPYDTNLHALFRSASLPTYFLLFSVPFFLAGACVSYTLTASTATVMKIYFWDLLGAAVGASLCPPLLRYLGGYGTVAASSLLGVLAWFAYGRLARAQKIGSVVWIVYAASLLCLLLYPEWAVSRYGFDIRSSKDGLQRTILDRDFGGIEATRWNAIARIDVSHSGDSKEVAYRYGLARRAYDLDIPGRYILVDGGANTRQFQARAPLAEQTYLGEALWASPYIAHSVRKHSGPKKVLVIGGGGGIDILVAKYFRTAEVEVAEVNPSIYRILTGTAGDAEGERYQPWLESDETSSVKIHLSEARHFSTTRPSSSYDIIHASGVDTLTAITTGGKSLVENYLYTVEAVEEYARLLRSDGILSLTHWRWAQPIVSRWAPPVTALRMFLTYLEFLEKTGVEEPWRHVLVVGGLSWTDTLLKKTPFSGAEIEAVRDWARQAGHVVLFDPSGSLASQEGIMPQERIYATLGFADAEARRNILSDYPYDIAPVTDDRPYFYRVNKITSVVSIFGGQSVYLMFLFAFTGAVLLVLYPMLGLERRELSGRMLGYAAFFALCGFAFLFFEIGIIQLFTVFVGGPAYSLAVVLVCVLGGYAIGSWLAQYLRPKPRTFLALGVTLAAIFLGMYTLLPRLVEALMPLPFFWRVAVSATISLLAATFTGMPVSLAMHYVRSLHGSVVGWMWGVSSAFNVLGAMSFIPLTQFIGIAGSLVIVAALYLLANVWFAFRDSFGSPVPMP